MRCWRDSRRRSVRNVGGQLRPDRNLDRTQQRRWKLEHKRGLERRVISDGERSCRVWFAPATESDRNRHRGRWGRTLSLSGINFNSSYQYTIAGTNTITLNGAATIDVLSSNTGSPGVFPTGDTIRAPIGGSAGLTVEGPGVLTVTGLNAYTGGTTIASGGTLRLANNTSGQTDDSDLGATGAGNGITLNGGTLEWFKNAAAGAFVTARNISLGSGGGTLQGLTAGALWKGNIHRRD